MLRFDLCGRLKNLKERRLDVPRGTPISGLIGPVRIATANTQMIEAQSDRLGHLAPCTAAVPARGHASRTQVALLWARGDDNPAALHAEEGAEVADAVANQNEDRLGRLTLCASQLPHAASARSGIEAAPPTEADCFGPWIASCFQLSSGSSATAGLGEAGSAPPDRGPQPLASRDLQKRYLSTLPSPSPLLSTPSTAREIEAGSPLRNGLATADRIFRYIMVAKHLKSKVVREARALGADLVGFAPVSRWSEFDEVPEAYRPQAIWKQTKTVIVLGVPMLLPIIESTPSVNYTVMYDTSNGLLDQAAYRLAILLNGLGHASLFMPRDGYGSLEVLLEKMPACFSHVYAGKYAGLGTIGYNHLLLTRKYGPRARYVSIFTEAEIEGDPLIEEDLCNACGLCHKLCPTQSFETVKGSLLAKFDAIACTRYHQELLEGQRWPCGVCAKVCPTGDDRLLYGSTKVGLYLREREAIAKDPDDPRFRHLVHLRTHGSHGNGEPARPARTGGKPD